MRLDFFALVQFYSQSQYLRQEQLILDRLGLSHLKNKRPPPPSSSSSSPSTKSVSSQAQRSPSQPISSQRPSQSSTSLHQQYVAKQTAPRVPNENTMEQQISPQKPAPSHPIARLLPPSLHGTPAASSSSLSQASTAYDWPPTPGMSGLVTLE